MCSIALELHNFNLVIEILFALNSHPVNRLKKTWKLIPVKDLQLFSKLNQFYDSKGNFKKLRDAMEKNVDCVGIPYLGMYLIDSMFIEERHRDEKSDMINWTKRKLQSKLISEIQSYQKDPLEIPDFPELRKRLLDYFPLEMEELYALSLQIEQKGS
jgi:hypothetical protein